MPWLGTKRPLRIDHGVGLLARELGQDLLAALAQLGSVAPADGDASQPEALLQPAQRALEQVEQAVLLEVAQVSRLGQAQRAQQAVVERPITEREATRVLGGRRAAVITEARRLEQTLIATVVNRQHARRRALQIERGQGRVVVMRVIDVGLEAPGQRGDRLVEDRVDGSVLPGQCVGRDAGLAERIALAAAAGVEAGLGGVLEQGAPRQQRVLEEVELGPARVPAMPHAHALAPRPKLHAQRRPALQAPPRHPLVEHEGARHPGPAAGRGGSARRARNRRGRDIGGQLGEEVVDHQRLATGLHIERPPKGVPEVLEATKLHRREQDMGSPGSDIGQPPRRGRDAPSPRRAGERWPSARQAEEQDDDPGQAAAKVTMLHG
jgi:hypothetical protein